MRESARQREILTIVVRDSQGRIKPVFQENRLFLWLIRKGLSPHFPKIPVLLGRWQNHKEITNDYERR